MERIAETLAEAKLGDTVFMFDSQAPRYDQNKKYQGRGCWKDCEITAENKVSFTAGGYKFNRKTGDEMSLRGYSASRHLYGEKEKEDRQYISEHRWNISKSVEDCSDVEALKKINSIIEELK